MDALVLSGGSIKGSYQAGAIEEVLKAGYSPQIVTGISVGALNAAGLAAWERHGWPIAGAYLTDFWKREVTGPDKLIKRRGTIELVYRAVTRRWRGFVNADRVATLTHKTLEADLAKGGRKAQYRVGAVNLASGQVEYHSADSPDFLDAVMASAAMPVIFPTTWIGASKDHYTDGGVIDIAPLKQAITLGATRIVAVVCEPEGRSKWTADPHDPLKLADRLMGVVSDGILAADLDKAQIVNQDEAKARVLGSAPEKRIIELITIRPSRGLGLNIENFTSDQIHAAIALGRNDAKRVIAEGGLAT
jgi:NTE family protein